MLPPICFGLAFIVQAVFAEHGNSADKSEILDRRPRSLSSIVGLLWPQVVGPMKDGRIVEPGFDDVAETPIEGHLRSARQKAEIETRTRQRIRDILNYRMGQPLLPLPMYELELHPLVEQHLEMLPYPHNNPYLDLIQAR